MRIRTRSELTDRLDEDLALRKVELSAVKGEVDTAREERRSALIRAGVALLYAHWEGFVKQAATLYLNYVSMQGLRYDELAANFLGVAIKRALDEAADTKKAKTYTRVAHVFGSSLHQRAKLPYDVVDTQSNLSVDVFTNILCLLGLQRDPYAPQEKPLIGRLLHLRNNIAHGRWMKVDEEEYQQLHQGIMNLLNLFRNDIDNATLTAAYRRPEDTRAHPVPS